MPLIIKSNEQEKLAPHLALTHKEQGYSANGRHVSLLLKSDVELDDETKAILKSLLGENSEITTEDIEKQSYEGKRKLLNQAVNEQFKSYPWDWVYVEDFDENVVVFSNSDGVYYADYTIESDSVSLGEATSANRVLSYKDDTNSIVLSESDTISKSVSSLIAKSFDTISSNEKLKDVFKSKFMEGKKVMDELQKSVDLLKSQLTDLQTQLEKANQEKQAAQDALVAIEKAQKEAKSAQRLEKLKEVAAEDQIESLHKSLENLDDEAFETVIKSLETSKKIVEESDLFKQKSKKGEEATADSRAKFQENLRKQYKVQE